MAPTLPSEASNCNCSNLSRNLRAHSLAAYGSHHSSRTCLSHFFDNAWPAEVISVESSFRFVGYSTAATRAYCGRRFPGDDHLVQTVSYGSRFSQGQAARVNMQVGRRMGAYETTNICRRKTWRMEASPFPTLFTQVCSPLSSSSQPSIPSHERSWWHHHLRSCRDRLASPRVGECISLPVAFLPQLHEAPVVFVNSPVHSRLLPASITRSVVPRMLGGIPKISK